MEEFVKEKMDLSEFENINHISLNIIVILEHKKNLHFGGFIFLFYIKAVIYILIVFQLT